MMVVVESACQLNGVPSMDLRVGSLGGKLVESLCFYEDEDGVEKGYFAFVDLFLRFKGLYTMRFYLLDIERYFIGLMIACNGDGILL